MMCSRIKVAILFHAGLLSVVVHANPMIKPVSHIVPPRKILDSGYWEDFEINSQVSQDIEFESETPVILQVVDAFCRLGSLSISDNGEELFHFEKSLEEESTVCTEDLLDRHVSILVQPGEHIIRVAGALNSETAGTTALIRADRVKKREKGALGIKGKPKAKPDGHRGRTKPNFEKPAFLNRHTSRSTTFKPAQRKKPVRQSTIIKGDH